ncbi:MAG: threonine ammonia-lyase [bacterium]|nr:threonine ammonia-lyase [bacterium]
MGAPSISDCGDYGLRFSRDSSGGSSVAVTFKDVSNAADVVRDHVERTPTKLSRTLSRISGAQVFLKFENLQFTGAFKERGALVKLDSLLPSERESGVIALSAGNHAQGVAYHAKRLGIHATIVMPRFTPNVKVEHTRVLGAEVLLVGDDLEQARAHAHELARTRGLVLIHPYDDERVIAGQGTIALEMLEDQPEIDTLLIPIGGGGLISGNAIAAHGIRSDIDVVGAQVDSYASMRQVMRNEPVDCGGATIAEGIAVAQPGKLTVPIVREHVRDILLVNDEQIEESVRLLLEIEKTVVEGAGAAGLAALLRHPDQFAGRRVGLILSGGNIDPLVLSSIIQRGLVRSSRLARIKVELRDVPGVLAEISRIIGEADGNVVEVHHQRAFTTAPLSRAEVLFVLETRGDDHLAKIIETLQEAGFPTHV